MKAKEFIIESSRSLMVEGTTVYEKQYKGYTIRVVDNRPKSKGFVGIAFKPGKNKIMDTFYVKTPKATPAEVEQELNVYVDGKRSLPNNSLTQFKSGNITMFFNAMLSKEIFAPDSVLYADIENVNGNPVLIISDDDQGGMHKVYDRNINKESGRGTGIFIMPRKKAITAGLTLSRYDLGREIDYGVPNVDAYELKWNSDVIPDEPMKLGGSGLTVSPSTKGLEMDEAVIMPEVEDILNESKKFAAAKMPKQRDPNWQTLQAKGTSGAGGKHIDKKRAEKQGDVKHKKQAVPMEGVAESKPGWMLKQDPKLAAKVKAKTDLAKKRQASYGDPSAGKSADKKNVSESEDNLSIYSKRELVRIFNEKWKGGSVEKAIQDTIDSLYAAHFLDNSQFDDAREFLYYVADMEQQHDKPHPDHEEDRMGLGLMHDNRDVKEVSKDTLKSYTDKAMKTPPQKSWVNRIQGIGRAAEKIKKNELKKTKEFEKDVAEGFQEEDPLELGSDYALYIANAGRKMITQLTNLAKKIQTDSAAAQNAKRWNLGDYMHQHYETDDMSAINDVFEEYGVGGFFDQNLYELLAYWSTQGAEYVNTWKQYTGDVLKNSTRKPSAPNLLLQGVAEGSDSEELANEVYAEFERVYPKLASRANQQTVHAAIMDVLNYGNDSNPSALAQDVARAVKRDIAQGVAEVSKGTLDRYVAKASDAHGHADFAARMTKDDPTLRSYHKDQKRTAEKRRQGISRALDRMSREDIETTVNELSSEMLGRYKKAASADATAADAKGDYKHGDKRFSGIVKATKKQFANDAKGKK
jgi:hypothetical protein